MIETEQIHLHDADYEVKFFKHTSLSGMVSYSLEIGFGAEDKVVIDDCSFGKLRSKLNLILPAALYSRMIRARIRR